TLVLLLARTSLRVCDLLIATEYWLCLYADVLSVSGPEAQGFQLVDRQLAAD
ncbi:unnamed protein product, partial [Amoebophrya sp. A120]